MTLLVVLVVVGVLLLVVAASVPLVARRSRSRRREEQRERSREEFGEEYDRVAEERGSEEEAEKELRTRRGQLERRVRPLSDESRQGYEERWAEVERVFVENPERSIEMADRTVSDLLEERNFVADAAQEDRETTEGLAAMYPEVAGDYREARRIRANIVTRSARQEEGSDEEHGEGATEDLRQAIRRYRSVYERLVEE